MTNERAETSDAAGSEATRPRSPTVTSSGSSLEFQRLLVRIGVASPSNTGLFDGRYRIEETLGRGAMGVVYRANDERLDRKVALKLVRSVPGRRSSTLHARLEREARALARLDHPNVVQIHDVGSHDGEIYLSMQYVGGTTLRAWQARGDRSVRELLDAYLAAARGLAAAHAAGIVHRDFKPDNVIIGDDESVRVVDFGIAAAVRELEQATGLALVEADEQREPADLARLTRTGALVGTPAYMAPEQLVGADVDARADQFGFCVALWEALAGARPFSGTRVAQLRDARSSAPEGGERIPRRLRPALLRGLAPAPADRFERTDDLIAALERARDRPRKLALVGGLAAGLLVAASAGWATSQANRVELEPCAAFVAEVDAVWTAQRRAGIEARRGVDEAAVAYAIAKLDALTEQWRGSAASLCEAEVAPAKDSRERACRTEWLASLDRSVALLIDSDAGLARAPDLLERLSPPGGRYCALEPEPELDREVARLTASAREAALLGDAERAASLAVAALERAGEGQASVDRAEALSAHGEVLARAGDYEAALRVFAQAQAEALASGHRRALLSAATWRAKLASARGGPEQGELAATYLELAEPMARKLELADDDPRRGEIELARGLIAQARGDADQAIAELRVAQATFAAAGQPTLVAKALNNIGVNYQQLERFDHARAAYREAIAILREAGVPPSYSSLLNAHYNIGILDVQVGRIAGLEHLEEVARHHPNPVKRLIALNYAVVLTHSSEAPEPASAWAERSLAQLEALADAVPADLAAEVEMQAGVALARTDAPRGEALMAAAEARAEALDAETKVYLRRARIDSLVERGRCDEARDRVVSYEQFLSEQPQQLVELVDHARWREGWLASGCAQPPKAEQAK